MRFETLVITRYDNAGRRKLDGQSLPEGYVRPRVRYVKSRYKESKWSLVQLNMAAARAAGTFSADIVLSGHIATNPAASFIKKSTGVPVVQYLHADEVTAHRWLSRFALREAEVSIAVSDYTRTLALEFGADPDRLLVIPPGVDDLSACRPIPRRRACPTLITVARLTDRYKGHDVMLRALPLILKQVPDCEWIIIGDGLIASELKQTARAKGLDNHVRFVGAVGDTERDVLLDEAHVFIMPSRLPPGEGGEGFGIVYLEAGMHGLPVIAGDVAGALDAVERDRTGLLVDPTDERAIATAAIRLLTNRAEAEKMGRAGGERARRFTWPFIAERVEQTLRNAALCN